MNQTEIETQDPKFLPEALPTELSGAVFLSSLTVTFLPLQMIFAFIDHAWLSPLYPGHSTNCNKIGEI